MSAAVFEDIGDVGRGADSVVNGAVKALGDAGKGVTRAFDDQAFRTSGELPAVAKPMRPPGKTPERCFWNGTERPCKIVKALEKHHAEQQASLYKQQQAHGERRREKAEPRAKRRAATREFILELIRGLNGTGLTLGR